MCLHALGNLFNLLLALLALLKDSCDALIEFPAGNLRTQILGGGARSLPLGAPLFHHRTRFGLEFLHSDPQRGGDLHSPVAAAGLLSEPSLITLDL